MTITGCAWVIDIACNSALACLVSPYVDALYQYKYILYLELVHVRFKIGKPERKQ